MRSGLPRLRAVWVAAAVLAAAPVLGLTVTRAHDSVTQAHESLAQAQDSVRGALTPSAVAPGGAAGAGREDAGPAGFYGPAGSAGSHGSAGGSAGSTESSGPVGPAGLAESAEPLGPLGPPRPVEPTDSAGPGTSHAVVGLILAGVAAVAVAGRCRPSASNLRSSAVRLRPWPGRQVYRPRRKGPV
ncbi:MULTISPECIES: hypothetical protein [unclassified Streptomyces]|uniref:hypothetical protein n=1 Tax=unclassified Streptomyces TaxID=2593676 RepID=UPI00081E36A2|nr:MULTISPECIES: hypothetical protein [unclassified Streptomyces]MYZ35255.1 hypothetical protein [Streptomyces sp. SID4917]SCF74005.1 hypothetical protein GA0115259_101883 [Streptomyces sp. MnatMP-M17]